jgi:hypothetical protein
MLIILGGISGKWLFEEHTGEGKNFTVLVSCFFVILGIVALFRSKKSKAR